MAVTLEGPSREKWKVEMDGALSKFSVSFSQGWKKFVADHVLQIGDQVSFTLTADSQFHVEVQGRTRGADFDYLYKRSFCSFIGSKNVRSLLELLIDLYLNPCGYFQCWTDIILFQS